MKAKYQILLVEDSIDIQLLVADLLSPLAAVTAVTTMSAALAVLGLKKDFDLFLFDVGLADGDGFNLAWELKQRPECQDIPVVFMTSKTGIDDKEKGFSLGAEDYVVKPFEPRELALRVERRLKSSRKHTQSFVRAGLRFDIPSQRVFVATTNEPIDLTPLQFKLLYFLITQEARVVSREQLISNIWGDDVHIGRSIDTHINSLRRKLGARAKCIHTIYGEGYKFASGFS